MTGAYLDLGLSPAQQAMRVELHAIARTDLRGRAAEAERAGLDLPALVRQLDKVGLAPATLFERGIDDPHTLLVAVEELAYGDAGIAWAAVSAFQVATIVCACGTEAHRRVAAAAFTGNEAATASFLVYEDFGRRPSEFETTVTWAGAGWTVTGRKGSVAYPADADLSLLVGRDGDEPAAFCFAGARAGLAGGREAGRIGLDATPSGPVSIREAAFDADERLAGGPALHRAIGQARLLVAAASVGLARAALEYCAAYAVQRTTWGTPLAQHQGVSFPLIELTTELEEVRLLSWDVAASLAGLDEVAEIERRVTRAVNRASSLALRATRDAVQLIGVRGITRELPVERWYRHAAALGAVDFDLLETPFGLS